MRKIIAVLIPTAIVALFVLIMLSGSYLKQSFNENDNVPAIIEDIASDVRDGNWAAAGEGATQLEKSWKIITGRVQFSTEREELKNGKTSIARMKGFIEANDKAGVLSELSEVKENWSEIGTLF